MIKLAFSTLGCPDWSFDDILSMAKDLGFDAIEIRGIERDMFAPSAKPFLPENIEKTKERLGKLGLSISCLTSGVRLNETYRIESHMADGKAYIDLAQKLEVPFVRVIGDSGPNPTDVPFDDVALRLKELAEYAKDKDVTILIENNGAFADSDVMSKLLDAVNMDNVAVLWDINHPVRFFGENVSETYEKIGSHVQYFHIKDSLEVDGNVEYQMIGKGDLPIKELVALLKEKNFEGYLSLEWLKRWCLSLAEPGIVFPRYISFMRGLLREEKNA